MEIKRIKKQINGFDTIVVGNWALIDGNIIFHKNDVFHITKRYPQITQDMIDQIIDLFDDESIDVKELERIAKEENNRGLAMMTIYIKRGYKAMDTARKDLKLLKNGTVKLKLN